MIVILTGPVHSGKTSLLLTLAAEWQARGLAFDGYLSPRVEAAGRPLGYDLLDLKTGKTVPFLRTNGEPRWQRVGPYYLLPGGLVAAKRKFIGWTGSGALVIDEIGPLELRGGGVGPELRAAAPAGRLLLLVVRRSILARLAEILPDNEMKVVSIEAPGAGILLSRAIEAGQTIEGGRKMPPPIGDGKG